MSRRPSHPLPDLPPVRVELINLAAAADQNIDTSRLQGLLIGARDAGMPWRDILRETTRMLILAEDLRDLGNAFDAWRKAHPARPGQGPALARELLAKNREDPMPNPPNNEADGD